VTFAFETGQETAALLRQTLVELDCPNLKVNFDPANVLLYDMGDPLEAVETLAPYIVRVHVKDALRPTVPGQWGTETPLGSGQVKIAEYVQALHKIGYTAPMCIERETADKQQRFADIATGISQLRSLIV
jgi:sugar phosphate isomerase/epimerase